uniref:Uncharacterized protein n=1 Tax=Globodera pallida TaxID=36090 RepID=A0A183BMD0_GLOPA
MRLLHQSKPPFNRTFLDHRDRVELGYETGTMEQQQQNSADDIHTERFIINMLLSDSQLSLDSLKRIEETLRQKRIEVELNDSQMRALLLHDFLEMMIEKRDQTSASTPKARVQNKRRRKRRPPQLKWKFKKLKHSSNSTSTFASEANGNNSTQNSDHQSTRDQANIATKLIPATNSPRVELGLVLSNNVRREPSPGSLTSDGIGAEGEGKLKKGNAEHNVNEILPSESSLSNGRTIGTVKGGGKRLLSALFPGRRKGRLGLSFSEPRLNFDVELPKNGFGSVEVDDENIVGNGGQCEDHQQSFGERNRLCEGTSDAHKARSHFAGALQKVREKLHVHSAPISNEISPSSSLHRSNTTPIPFSMRDSNDKNLVTNKNERADVRQQPIEGKVLAKLRKQAKIMDIVVRKSHGNSGKNRKSDGQRLLISEDGYCSGLE